MYKHKLSVTTIIIISTSGIRRIILVLYVYVLPFCLHVLMNINVLDITLLSELV